MEKTFDDPHEKLKQGIDNLFGDIPPELQKVTDNLKFINEIRDSDIPPGLGRQRVFGVEIVDVNAILKDNIWNRSIFTVDKLCKMFLQADLEQKKKYLKKKRPLEFSFLWLLILIMLGLGGVAFVIVFLLPRLGGVMP